MTQSKHTKEYSEELCIDNRHVNSKNNNVNISKKQKKYFKITLIIIGIIAFVYWIFCCIQSVSHLKYIAANKYLLLSILGFLLFIKLARIIFHSKKKKSYQKPAASDKTDSVKKSSTRTKQSKIVSEEDHKFYDDMKGPEFENFCAELLRKNNFINVEVTQVSGDYGIDILAEKDNITYAIQCKRYSDNIGNKAVQEAYSGKDYYDCMIGAVMTNRHFTKSAKETARQNNILLWDRDYLDKMIRNKK